MIDPLALWGKARLTDGSGVPYHPLVFHCLDVAACFERLVQKRTRTRAMLEVQFDAHLATLLPGLTALVALHDIGKALPVFQIKVPELCPPAMRSSAVAGHAYNHAAGGYSLLSRHLSDCLSPVVSSLGSEECTPLFQAIAHHHGRPLPNADYEIGRWLTSDTIETAQRVAMAILSSFDQSALGLPQIDERAAQRLSWPLSGLITLADWLGSSGHFPYVAPDGLSPGDYWNTIAKPRAETAIVAAGLGETGVRRQTGGHALFGPSFDARPAQHTAETVEIGTGPQLFILEEMTGAGKTEAALILAHRMMTEGRASGLFIALPTTATADAMYQRMAGAYAQLFSEGSLPSLALAHGRRHLNDGFKASLFTDAAASGPSPEDDENSIACNVFFADDRRKTFLADVGVGTVDQALMAVLPTKFATLRQYGLSDKVLIIDEIHAYDAYMSKEVERLLTFHAAAGGSAILLSATLPKKTRVAFARAYKGGSRRTSVALAQDAYPLLCRIPADATAAPAEHPIMPTQRHSVHIQRLAACTDAHDLIVKAAHAGAAVAYIRNSVDDARETADALRAIGLDPILFHARFAMGDRLAIEKVVLATFGKTSDAQTRAGKVLVATQVAEQSLDLDFDVMVSDLAPVDLLIQRAGRLWRHQRERRVVDAPLLHIVSPEPVDDAGKNWLLQTLRNTSYVYKAHGLLWLTAKHLFEAGHIGGPEDMRRLVETVYAPDLAGADAGLLPEGLRAAEIRKTGDDNAGRSLADQNLLDLNQGYCVSNRAWQSDTITPTRLGEAQCIFRLAVWQEGRLRPWAALLPDSGGDPVRLWALSEISVRVSQANGRPDLLSPLKEAVAAVEQRWKSLSGDGALILPLEHSGSDWTGMILRPHGNTTIPVAVRYSSKTGLAFG